MGNQTVIDPSVANTMHYEIDPSARFILTDSDDAFTVARGRGERGSVNRRVMAIGAGAATLAAVVGSYFVGRSSDSDTTSALATEPTAGQVAGANGVTDDELRLAGYGCGPKNRPEQQPGEFDFGYQIDYLNSNRKDLAAELYKFNVNHPLYGMGEKAWNGLLKNGLSNLDTSTDKKLAEDKGGMNTHLHQIGRVDVKDSRLSQNFMCPVDRAIATASNRPVIVLGKDGQKNSLDGVRLTEEGLAEFKKDARNLETFHIVDLGLEEVTNADGSKARIRLFMVGLYAGGCENPQRIPKTPKTPPETSPPTVPAPVPGQPTPPAPPRKPDEPTPTPLAIPKMDGTTNPGDGTPRSQDRSAGDEVGAGEGPAGQPVNEEGRVPGDVQTDANKDDDGDGISNGADACPAEKETANGYQDGDGCPDVRPSSTPAPVAGETPPTTGVQQEAPPTPVTTVAPPANAKPTPTPAP